MVRKIARTLSCLGVGVDELPGPGAVRGGDEVQQPSLDGVGLCVCRGHSGI